MSRLNPRIAWESQGAKKLTEGITQFGHRELDFVVNRRPEPTGMPPFLWLGPAGAAGQSAMRRSVPRGCVIDLIRLGRDSEQTPDLHDYDRGMLLDRIQKGGCG